MKTFLALLTVSILALRLLWADGTPYYGGGGGGGATTTYSQLQTNFNVYYSSGLITPAAVTNGGAYVWNPNLIWTNQAGGTVLGGLTNSAGLNIVYDAGQADSFLGTYPPDMAGDTTVYFFVATDVTSNRQESANTWTANTGTGTLVTTNGPGLSYLQTVYVQQGNGLLGFIYTNATVVNYSGGVTGGGGGLFLGTGNTPGTNYGIQQIAIGDSVMKYDTNDSGTFQNTFIGQGIGEFGISNQQDEAIGWSCFQYATNTGDCVGIGWQDLKYDQGLQNIAIGDTVLRDKKLGSFNDFIGTFAGASVNDTVAGSQLWNSTALGANTFAQLDSGTNITAIGSRAGGTLTSGTNDTYIGANVGAGSANENNTTRIGNAQTALILSGVVTAPSLLTVNSNGLALNQITFPATTLTWTNTAANTVSPVRNIFLYVDNSGVTGTAFKKNGTTVSTSIVAGDMIVPLKPGDFISETYTIGTPVGKWEPQ
jgi:hypothetical protein